MSTHSRISWIGFAVLVLSTVSPAQETRHNDTPINSWYGVALDGTPCQGQEAAHGGPYDYTNPEHRRCCLHLAEKSHWSPEVESLLKGRTSMYVTHDLDFVLRYFPNHHRALLAMIRFRLLYKDAASPSYVPPVECYLQRAAALNPSDANVPFLYGFYLHRKGLYGRALEQYKKSESLAPDHPPLQYYMAKLYSDMGQKDKATEHAKKASKLGVSIGALN